MWESFQEEAAFETGRMRRLWMDGDGNRRKAGICSKSNKDREVDVSRLCTG